MSNNPNIRKKDIGWMRHLNRHVGMYPGQHFDFVPSPVVSRLTRLGFVELFVPHNPAHKDRLVLTASGRRFIEECDAGAAA